MATAAIGTDTGGSARLPAALCGIVGFRPTTGRYPQDGMALISPTRDTIGFMAQSVADIIALDAATISSDKKGQQITIVPADLRQVRIGVPRAHFYDNLDPHVQAVTDKFLARLSSSKNVGVTVVNPVDLTGFPSLNAKVSMPVCLYETSQVLPEYLLQHDTGVSLEALIDGIQSPDVKEL